MNLILILLYALFGEMLELQLEKYHRIMYTVMTIKIFYIFYSQTEILFEEMTAL